MEQVALQMSNHLQKQNNELLKPIRLRKQYVKPEILEKLNSEGWTTKRK